MKEGSNGKCSRIWKTSWEATSSNFRFHLWNGRFGSSFFVLIRNYVKFAHRNVYVMHMAPTDYQAHFFCNYSLIPYANQQDTFAFFSSFIF